MKRQAAVFVLVIWLTMVILAGVSLAGARYLRDAAWSGSAEPVTFIQIGRLRLD